MPEFCTCGAQLPPDALFCHKCGKPQREIVVPETVSPPPPPIPPSIPTVALAPLNFRNPVAIRISMLVAVVATICGFVLPFLNWLAAGFFAAFFYSRKTGNSLNVGAGVRMGWITGILMFGPWAIIFIAEQIPAARSGKLAAALQEQMTRSFPAQDPMVQQAVTFFHTWPGIAAMLAVSLAALFCFITVLSMAGGALAAKVVGRS